jgi:hypothetical protein
MSRIAGNCLLIAMALGLSLVGFARAEEKRPSNSREMFRFLGAGDTYFERMTGGVPVDTDELDPLLRILFKLRQFPAADMERWAIDGDKLGEAIGQAGKFRGSIFRLRGRVIAVEPQRPTAEQSQRYEMPRYFRCRLQIDSPPCFADIYTEDVPVAWRKGSKPNVDGGAFGVFLKTAKKIDNRDAPVFVAPRIAWYSDDLLGRLGMDYGLLDDLANVKNMSPEKHDSLDREAFLEMLAAVGRAKPGELARQADADLTSAPKDLKWTDREGKPHFSVVPLFNQPKTQVGRLVVLSGTARLIEKVYVEDPNAVARFGFDHYFLVSLFTDDSNGNPLTFCVRELPEGMPYGNLPHYGESVRIAGFFYKTWVYPVKRMADPSLMSNPKTGGQASPLLFGRSLVWYRAPKSASTPGLNTFVFASLAVVMLAIWGLAWRSRIREKRRRAESLGTTTKLDSVGDLGRIGENPQAAPDFDRIAEMDQGPERKDNE